MLYFFYEQPMQFNPILDSVRYNAYVLWNFAGQRWFIRLEDTTGDLILNGPVIESNADYPIDLLKGYGFNTTMIFNETVNAFEVK